MKIFNRLLIIGAVVSSVAFASLHAYAEDNSFSIGSVDITIPTPPDYLLITPDLGELYRLAQLITPSTHEHVAYYLGIEHLIDFTLADAGEFVQGDRAMLVRTPKTAKHDLTTNQQFRAHKKSTRKFLNKLINSKLPRWRDSIQEEVHGIEKNITDELFYEVDIDIDSITYLEPHYETEYAIGKSALMNITNPAGSHIISGTFITANVAGKILNIYVYGKWNDLHWTRAMARNWTEEILINNSPPPR